MTDDWYRIKDIDKIDSPALVVYRERVLENIGTLISMIDDIKRLRPHVKTHKTKEVAELMISVGINKFKCATISEAEMLGMARAHDVLLAYQPTGPKLKRFIELIKKFPSTRYSSLTDNIISAKEIAGEALRNNITIVVYLDLNVGMNRTGILPDENALELYKLCKDLKGIETMGLHVYDGHIRKSDFEERTIDCDKAFEPVLQMQKILIESGFPEPIIIAGGSPTFSIHAKRKDIECSPGTFIYWDRSYQQTLKEQNFVTAALVITRIISLPAKGIICLDLGHKSIAAENDLSKRVYFLNAPELKFLSQSEEHLVAETSSNHSYKVGDILYGLPFHICPTVALYERAFVIKNNEMVDEWKIIARDRKISV